MAHVGKFGTDFFERYARISLIDLLGSHYAGLVNSDRPDLQDAKNSIGIEVTRALKENKVEAQLLENEIAGKEINDISPNEILQMQNTGYSFGLYKQIVGRKEYEYWAAALPLWRILETKIHKVADNFYGDFNEFGLYIFSKEDLTDSDVTSMIELANKLQANNTKRYGKIYLSQIQTMYVCNLGKNDFLKIEISKSQRRKFYNKAVE